MKVLVTGATGLVGKKLVKKLCERGYQVIATTRNKTKAASQLPADVQIVEWNNFYELPPEEAVAGIHAVVHLMGENIGAKRWSTTQKKILFDSRVESAKNIIAALKKKNTKIDAFITSSAIGIYPVNSKKAMDENTYLASGFLADLCKKWEEASNDKSVMLRHIAIRTGVVLGQNEGAMAKMLPIFKLGLGGPIGDGDQMMSWIHVDDLVEIFIKSLETAEIEGAINAVSPKAVDNFTFSKSLGKALHRPSLMLTPTLPLKFIFGEMSTIILDSQHVEPKRLQDLKFPFKYPDIDSAFHNLYQES